MSREESEITLRLSSPCVKISIEQTDDWQTVGNRLIWDKNRLKTFAPYKMPQTSVVSKRSKRLSAQTKMSQIKRLFVQTLQTTELYGISYGANGFKRFQRLPDEVSQSIFFHKGVYFPLHCLKSNMFGKMTRGLRRRKSKISLLPPRKKKCSFVVQKRA